MSGGWWRAWIPNFLFIPAKKSAVELILLFPLFEVSTERWPLKEGDGDGDVDGDGDEYGDDDDNNNNTGREDNVNNNNNDNNNNRFIKKCLI